MRNVHDKSYHECTVLTLLEETLTVRAKPSSRKSGRQSTLFSNMVGAKNTEINIKDVNSPKTLIHP